MADITRPEFLRSTTLGEHLRWQKHTTDNIDRINAPKPFISLARTTASLSTTSGTISFIPFTDIQQSQGNAPTWSADDPTSLYISEDGVWQLDYNMHWDTPTSGAITVKRASNMTATYNTPTPMQWSAIDSQEGSGITWSSGANTRLTFARAGRVMLSTDLILYNTSAGGYRESYWCKNGDMASVFGYDLTPGGVYAGTSGTGEITVVAGDYLELYLFQNQTAAVDLSVLGTTANPLRGTARFVDSGASVRSSGLAINDYYGPDRETGALGLVGSLETYSGGYSSVSGSAVLQLSAGDKVQLRALQSSGAALSVLSYPYTELRATRL